MCHPLSVMEGFMGDTFEIILQIIHTNRYTDGLRSLKI